MVEQKNGKNKERENSLRQSLSVLWRARIIRKSLKPELVRRHLTNSGSPYGEQTSTTPAHNIVDWLKENYLEKWQESLISRDLIGHI